MANLDLKYYWAVFLRRLPYFLVIAALLAAIGITVASILPPVYQLARRACWSSRSRSRATSRRARCRSTRSSRSRSSSSG